MSDKMEERGFLDGNQGSSWLPQENVAGYGFRRSTMRSPGDGLWPAKRSDVLWTPSRRQKIYTSAHIYSIYRIIESFRLQKTFKIIESNCEPNTTKSH